MKITSYLVVIIIFMGIGLHAQYTQGGFNVSHLRGNDNGFDKNGVCRKCGGKGKIENSSYDSKKMDSKKTIICPNCKGKGKQERQIDGRKLITSDNKVFYDFCVQNINSQRILVEHKTGTAEIAPSNWPVDQRGIIESRLYLDDKMNLYDMKTAGKDNAIKPGSYFLVKGTPERTGTQARLIISATRFRIVNANDHDEIDYNHECEIALLVIGKPNRDYYTAELLKKPSKQQLDDYFNGKAMTE